MKFHFSSTVAKQFFDLLRERGFIGSLDPREITLRFRWDNAVEIEVICYAEDQLLKGLAEMVLLDQHFENPFREFLTPTNEIPPEAAAAIQAGAPCCEEHGGFLVPDAEAVELVKRLEDGP